MAEAQFGRYQLLQLLGRGGMGEVWRARDSLTDNRIVAVKILPANLANDDVFKQRFRREAQAAARLNNLHVIPIHGYGEIEGRLYVDMRLIEGRDLKEVLADGPLEVSRAVRIVEQVAKALHAAHKVGLVHRDVKPSNILLDEDDNAYLIDFGIARAADQTGLTGTGATIGTWHYMAPERFSAREADARADIYALACVLYECLTGSQPFPGDSLEQQFGGHVATPPPRPSTAEPTVPEALDEVIATGMAKNPGERYATTVAMARAAQDAITTPIPRPAPAVAPPPPPRPAPGAVAPHTIADEQSRPRAAGVSPSAPTQHRPPDEVPTRRAATDRPPPPVQRPPQQVPTRRAPDQAPPAEPTPITRPWWRRRSVLISAGVVLSVVAVIVGVTVVLGRNQPAPTSSAPTSAAPQGPTQTVLPFTGLSDPSGVAVDTAGSVYVTDYTNSRVVTLASGSTAQTVLPLTGLRGPNGVAVDTAGNVYVADYGNDRVVTLAAGSTTQTVLPFTGLRSPVSVAVDSAGSVYVISLLDNRVVTLAAGSTTQTVLPLTGLNLPVDVAVDTAGSVYVTDTENNRVVTLAAGSTTQTVLPLTGLNHPTGVAVDAAGNVYVADSGRVVKLAAGSSTQTVLPFTGLNDPAGVAVDTAGSVYVTDWSNKRVVKLVAG